MTHADTAADTVIVGAGPIGCWVGAQLKKREPHQTVVIYERRPVYQRDHIMSIDKASFLQWSENGEDNARFLKKIYDAQSTCSIGWGLNGVPNAAAAKPVIDLSGLSANRLSYWLALPRILDIKASDLEKILKEECEAMGVRFVYREITTLEDAMDAHPGCTRFIDASGANSKLREQLLGKDWASKKRDIFPSLDFNYTSHGQAAYLRINTFDKLGHVYAENIDLEQNGTSRVNLRMIVSREEYDALPEANFRKPLVITPDAAFWNHLKPSRTYGRTLKQDFYDLRALRHQFAQDNPTEAPVTMTKIYLSTYRAKKFAQDVQHNGQRKSWFLVGDAPMGMPFYRSVNSGLILGSQLAYLLMTPLVPDSQKVNVYNYYTRPCRIARESVNVARTEARIMLYKNILRPAFHHIAHSAAAPLVRVPTDFALRTLKYGKTS